MTSLSESDVGSAALAWLESVGWRVAHGPDIAPGTLDTEREDYSQVLLERRLRTALGQVKP